MKKLFSRQVKLFGRTIPIATVLAALTVVGVGAWAILVAIGQVTVATADQEIEWVATGVWECSPEGGRDNSGLQIATCGATSSEGPNVALSGIQAAGFGVELVRTFIPQEQGLCFGIQSTGVVPPGLTITADVLGARDLGDPTPITLKVRGTPALGPGMSLTIPDIVLGTVACP